jgi:hypothetical protein
MYEQFIIDLLRSISRIGNLAGLYLSALAESRQACVIYELAVLAENDTLRYTIASIPRL